MDMIHAAYYCDHDRFITGAIPRIGLFGERELC